MIAAFARFAAMLSCLSIAGLAVYHLSASAADILSRNHRWIVEAERYTVSPVMDQLFYSAVYRGIIGYDPEVDTLFVLTPREYSALSESSSQAFQRPYVRSLTRRQSKDPYDADTTLRLLWSRRGAGHDIRTIVEEFQKNRTLIAVRDSGLTPPCSALRNTNCVERPWDVSLVLDADLQNRANDAAATVSTAALDTAALDPMIFRSFGQAARRYSSWTIARGSELTTGLFHLSPRPDYLEPTGEAIAIDIVGRLQRAPEGAQVTEFCLDIDDTGALRFRSTRLRRCSPEESGTDRVFGARVEMSGYNSNWRISVQPITLPILEPTVRASLQEQAQSLQRQQRRRSTGRRLNDSTTARLRLDDRLRLSCNTVICVPELSTTTGRLVRLARDLALTDRLTRSLVQSTPDAVAQNESDDIAPPTTSVTTQPVSLVETSAADARFLEPQSTGGLRLSETALDLGLAQSLGIPGAAAGTYVGLLESLPSGVVAADLSLTYSPDMQTIAAEVFDEVLVSQTFAPTASDLLPDEEDNRRAAFTVIDLREGEDRGAVRVAVSYPLLDETLSLFDLQAFARGPEGSNPTASAVWRGLDSRFQPGSSMKLVSALSLARSITNLTDGVSITQSEQLGSAFLGTTAQNYRDIFQINPSERSWSFPLSRRPQDGDGTISDRGAALMPVSDTVASNCGRTNAGIYGVCEALARSSNMWFGRMSLAENQEALNTLYSLQSGDPDQFNDPVFTGLGQTLRMLGLGEPHPLVRFPEGIDASATVAPTIEAPNLPSAPGLASGTPSGEAPALAHLAVIQNAYGQNAQVTPLAMATIASSIGLRETVSPFIARTNGAPVPTAQPILGADELSNQLYSELVRGMRAVMQSGGTGFNGFGSAGPEAAELRSRVYGKTGTAQRTLEGSRPDFTHWFVGWINSDRGSPQFGFACAISHVADDANPCAAVSGAILAEFRQAGLL